MATGFKKSGQVIKRKKDRRKWFALLLLLLLFLLFGASVPLDKVPGVGRALAALGLPGVDNRGVTLFGVLSGSYNLKTGIYGSAFSARPGGAGAVFDGSRSDLSYALGSVSPFAVAGGSYLFNARGLQAAGAPVPPVAGVARRPAEGDDESSDRTIDPSKFTAPPLAEYNNIPFAAETPEGPPPLSSLSVLTGGSGIIGVSAWQQSMFAAAQRKSGMTGGNLQQMGNQNANYRTETAWAGNLRDFGPEPLNQAGTSWLFSNAGANARLAETQKMLARAAFDASVIMDKTILTEGSSGASVADQASVERDASKFVNDKAQMQACKDILAQYDSQLKDSRNKLATLATDLRKKTPGCCGPNQSNLINCNGDGLGVNAWKTALPPLIQACKDYNKIIDAINPPCGYRNTNSGDCDAIGDPGWGTIYQCQNFPVLTGQWDPFNPGNVFQVQVGPDGVPQSIIKLNNDALKNSVFP